MNHAPSIHTSKWLHSPFLVGASWYVRVDLQAKPSPTTSLKRVRVYPSGKLQNSRFVDDWIDSPGGGVDE
jgi:hypothetical protein